MSFRRSGSSSTAAAQTVLQPYQILAGLQVELDPKDVTLGTGQLVAQFNNTRGVGGACAQATAANQATLIDVDPNFSNQPSVQFAGTLSTDGDWYTLPNLSALTQGEAFCVLRSDYSWPGPTTPPSSAYTILWCIDNAGATNTLYNASPSNVSESFGSTSRVNLGSTGLNVNVPHIYNVRSAASSYTVYQSMAPSGGVIYTSASNTVGFRAVPYFGRNNNNNGFFNGRLAYLAITSTVQSAANRAKMLSYLANRFGLALP